ncbi:MAG: hypothetical protein EPN91_08635 [Salinibacterium sp.]|nr:MAG: hypothetical protein EPN91_08635 [Salinibacterium sp.]
MTKRKALDDIHRLVFRSEPAAGEAHEDEAGAAAMSVLKRVERWLADLHHDKRVVAVGLPPMALADLHAVLKLARARHDCDTCPVLADARAENRELKRRVRLTRAHVLREFAGPDETIARRLRRLYDLLDLRKPLRSTNT